MLYKKENRNFTLYGKHNLSQSGFLFAASATNYKKRNLAALPKIYTIFFHINFNVMNDYLQLLEDLYQEQDEILDFDFCTPFSEMIPDDEPLYKNTRKTNKQHNYKIF